MSWNITRVYICVHNRIYKRDIVSKTPKYIADIIILFTKYLRSIFTPLLSDWPNASNCVVSYDQLFKLSSLWGKTIFFLFTCYLVFYLNIIFRSLHPCQLDLNEFSSCPIVSYHMINCSSFLLCQGKLFFPVYVLFGVLSQHNIPVFTSMSVEFEWIFFLSFLVSGLNYKIGKPIKHTRVSCTSGSSVILL